MPATTNSTYEYGICPCITRRSDELCEKMETMKAAAFQDVIKDLAQYGLMAVQFVYAMKRYVEARETSLWNGLTDMQIACVMLFVYGDSEDVWSERMHSENALCPATKYRELNSHSAITLLSSVIGALTPEAALICALFLNDVDTITPSLFTVYAEPLRGMDRLILSNLSTVMVKCIKNKPRVALAFYSDNSGSPCFSIALAAFLLDNSIARELWVINCIETLEGKHLDRFHAIVVARIFGASLRPESANWTRAMAKRLKVAIREI